MTIRPIGIILNGVTGRMGTNQHLVRSILAIRKQGGIPTSEDLALAEQYGEPDHPLPWTTDLDRVLADPRSVIFFDTSGALSSPPNLGDVVD